MIEIVIGLVYGSALIAFVGGAWAVENACQQALDELRELGGNE